MIFESFVTKTHKLWINKVERYIGGVLFIFYLQKTNSRFVANRLLSININYSQLDLAKPRAKIP